MSRKQLIILTLAGGFIVLVVVFGFVSKDGVLPGAPARSGLGNEAAPEGADGMMGGEQVFTPEVPADAVVTTPDVETPASQNGDASFGVFNMTVSSAGFVPGTLTVKLGNLVQINLAAVGGACDFSLPYLGLSTRAVAGETKQVSFQTTRAGTYDFMCIGFSSGKTVRGDLIVTP
jgi:hypothetical protein